MTGPDELADALRAGPGRPPVRLDAAGRILAGAQVRRRRRHRAVIAGSVVAVVCAVVAATVGTAALRDRAPLAETAANDLFTTAGPSLPTGPAAPITPGTGTGTASAHDLIPSATTPGTPTGARSTTRTTPGPGRTAPTVSAHAATPALTPLPAGATPPQFVVVGLDGAGNHQLWTQWAALEASVPLHVTAFLSGTYLLTSASAQRYQGPGHQAGRSALAFGSAQDLDTEITDLNAARARGDEIGTTFVGNFCDRNRPSGNDWDTAAWTSELTSFFRLLRGVSVYNQPATPLQVTATDIHGARTPCAEGKPAEVDPALAAAGLTYSSSFTSAGLTWPRRDPATGIWELAVGKVALHGSTVRVRAADANFFQAQENSVEPGSAARSAADSAQVLATYRDMYAAAAAGNRAPLILDNHFTTTNGNAYTGALMTFLTDTCGKPDTYCVTASQLIAWMRVQDPAALAAWQARPGVLG